MNYLHYDHMGSVVAVTNASGAVVERRSFDPWGRVRQTNGTAAAGGDLPGGINAATDRGYTLHEHLEGLDLIHMNGRAYDPLLARFTSGDPVIAEPYEGGSYDRYAYVLNQPLEATDPTGLAPVDYNFAFQLQASGGSATGINVGTAISLPWGSVPNTNGGGNGQTVGAVSSSSGTIYGTAMEMSGVKVSTIGAQSGNGPTSQQIAAFWAEGQALMDRWGSQCNSACVADMRQKATDLNARMRAAGVSHGDRLRSGVIQLNGAVASAQGEWTSVLEAVATLGVQNIQDQAGRGPSGIAAKGATPVLNAPRQMMDHHLMPRQFKDFFSKRGIDIDAHTVSLGDVSHLKGVHGSGLGNMPGRWNQQWGDWISKNPNATAKDVYQQLGSMMDRYHLNDLPIHPYRK